MRQRYSTDLTDEQWAVIAPLFKGMRNRKWDKRELVNAVLYLVDNGCKWRNLPHDLPPYSTVHSFYRRARISGLWDKILQHLVEVTRKQEKNKGHKRHIMTDTLDNIFAVKVHRANLHDTKSGIFPAAKAWHKYPTIKVFCADSGYRKTFVDNVKVG